ncbi:protein CURVATURE THYLAKOID 1B, chloroplastic-like [Lotus japonicus]|uniref:Cyanobacterial aminoacyl-tRNA synthetase CAAD domain-containing protein n=1 Tax=Lotus japonicus TaxID=34305 RepID=I3SY72_LOTJA|nr:protein CURVATURE THYLAKOID 1B, chloroplastic-like [Lotus japonicus]AFK45214.1 unknown [Lotus japonicus]
MAATSSSALTISSSSTLLDGKAPRQPPSASPQCVSFPQNRQLKTTVHCRKIARNVKAMATGETSAEVDTTELPEFVKNLQETWDKVDDKYAVGSVVVASVLALWASTGLLSAIDKLPLIPGVLELVGIGYTGWFAYKNLVFKPDREDLLQKIKGTYDEIIGSS